MKGRSLRNCLYYSHRALIHTSICHHLPGSMSHMTAPHRPVCNLYHSSASLLPASPGRGDSRSLKTSIPLTHTLASTCCLLHNQEGLWSRRMLSFDEGSVHHQSKLCRGSSVCWRSGGGVGNSRESVCCGFIFPDDLHELPKLQLPPTEAGPPYCAPMTSALLAMC